MCAKDERAWYPTSQALVTVTLLDKKELQRRRFASSGV